MSAAETMDGAADPRIRDVGEIAAEHLFDMVVDLQPPVNFGDGPLGRRVLFHSAGGTFRGPTLRGQVLAGGGDWAVFRADGTMTLDVRLSLQMTDGALVHMTYGGRWATPSAIQAAMKDPATRYDVDPAQYYFRTNPLFETGSKEYAWLNDTVAVGKGYLVRGGVAYKVFRVR